MRFQQKQQVEREAKKTDILGSTARPLGKISSPSDLDETKLLTSSLGGGKVRQMFEERRDRERVGVDKSYPLKPISGNTTTTIRQTKPLNVVKPLSNTASRTPEYPSSTATTATARDPLNNTVVLSKYNSTNRVPSLKTTTTNGHTLNGGGGTAANINNNNNNNNNTITNSQNVIKLKSLSKPVETNMRKVEPHKVRFSEKMTIF